MPAVQYENALCLVFRYKRHILWCRRWRNQPLYSFVLIHYLVYILIACLRLKFHLHLLFMNSVTGRDRLCGGLVVRVPNYRYRGPGFDSRSYQIFWEVVGLEQGSLSLVKTIEELLERKRSGSGLKNREYCRRNPPLWPHDTLYPQKLELTSPTSSGRSVGIVRSRSKATVLLSVIIIIIIIMVGKDLDVFATGAVSLNDIYKHQPKRLNIVPSQF
jgi:hypothetical protein